MKQAKSGTFNFQAWVTFAFACLCLIVASPAIAGSDPPDVEEVPSTIIGLDNECMVYTGYSCITVGICCGNSPQILNGDIQNVQQQWMLDFWNGEMIIRFRQYTDMTIQALMMQARMIGGFFDAQNQNAAQLSIQRLQAQALRDYIPDETLCQFGTAARSLGASEALGRRAQIGISERAQNRQVLNVNANSANSQARGREPGRAADKIGRLNNFVDIFCDNTNEDSALDIVCDGAENNEQFNRDIDYARSFDMPLRLDLNFEEGGEATNDMENLFALNSNLYGNNILLNRPNPDLLSADAKGNDVQKWMDYRTVVAKRSVVQNSFATIAAMKAPGTNASYDYMETIMTNLGMNEDDRARYLGEENPSYYAQMEILTKRLYQNPAFYAHLMETPANVLRTQAALGAIGLMQQRDIADSMQRSEMLLSVLLELQASRSQNKTSDKAAQ